MILTQGKLGPGKLGIVDFSDFNLFENTIVLFLDRDLIERGNGGRLGII